MEIAVGSNPTQERLTPGILATRVHFRSLLPLYVVIFVGFVGYSLMITIFTPMIMRGDSPVVAAGTPTAHRTILLGILLCLYPLGHFLGSPIMGASLLPMYLVDEFHLGVSRISEFIGWVGVPIVLANLWLTGFLSARASIQTLTFWSALLTGTFMVMVVIPHPLASLWFTLFLTPLALALCLPSCTTLLSQAADERSEERDGQQPGATGGRRVALGP